MHIALSKVWHSVKLGGLCKTKAGAGDIPIYLFGQHLQFSFDMVLPQAQVLGSSQCQCWTMSLSFISLGAGTALPSPSEARLGCMSNIILLSRASTLNSVFCLATGSAALCSYVSLLLPLTTQRSSNRRLPR